MRLAIERVQPGQVAGWVAGPSGSDVRVRLLRDGVVIAESVAEPAKGADRAGFVLILPPEAAAETEQGEWQVEAVAGDGNAVSVRLRIPPASLPRRAAGQPLARLILDFQAGGTGGSCLREGWSWQEPVGTWAVGAHSRIALPAADTDGPHRLALELVPFLAPRVPRQRLGLRLNGRALGEAELTRADLTSRLELVTPAGLLATTGENILELLHPDHAAPAAHEPGSRDERPLSIRLISLTCAAERPTAPPRPVRRQAAILTTAWNERVNLPIWLRHYAASAPDAALFVIDHGSDDGSTDEIGGAHRIPIPRTEYDDPLRARFVSEIQQALLKYYDIVVYTDADELLVPHPGRYAGLGDYLARFRGKTASAVGLNVLHAVTREKAIDLGRPILAQRGWCQFTASMCKPALTAVPLTWETGFHSCDRPPALDPDLFNFHIKTMDMTLALERQHAMRDTVWSANTLARNFGAHQRAADHDFLEAFFQGPSRRIAAGEAGAFDFAEDLQRFQASVETDGRFWRPGHFLGRIARIPPEFAGCF